MADTLVNADDTKNIDFPVYMVYSKWSLPKLDSFLDDYGGAGFLRVVFGKEDKETDRTIAIFSDQTRDLLKSAGFFDSNRDDRSYGQPLRISPFLLNQNSFPGEGRNKTLFIPVPKELGALDTWVTDSITEKLNFFTEWDIIPHKSWTLNVPLKSRELGGVRGGCFVTFKKDIDLQRLAMVRVLLTDTYWPENQQTKERLVFHCYWARDREARVSSSDGHPKSGSETSGSQSPDDLKKSKEDKKRKTYQKIAHDAKPVTSKKAPVLPLSVQPVLKQEDVVPTVTVSVETVETVVPTVSADALEAL